MALIEEVSSEGFGWVCSKWGHPPPAWEGSQQWADLALSLDCASTVDFEKASYVTSSRLGFLLGEMEMYWSASAQLYYSNKQPLNIIA